MFDILLCGLFSEKTGLAKHFITPLTIVAMAISAVVFIDAFAFFMVSFYKRQRWKKTAMDDIVALR